MRKLKLQVQLTIDGFMAGVNGEMDWMTWDWDEELKQFVSELTAPVDCIILGRKLAEGFIPHWAGVAANPSDPEVEAGKKFTDTPKVVFTKNLSQAAWPNTVLATGDLADEVNKLKSEDGGDIIVYGGARFVSSLIKAGLIDEYHLFINPIAIGSGLPIFEALENNLRLALTSSRKYNCGIVVNTYIPAQD